MVKRKIYFMMKGDRLMTTKRWKKILLASVATTMLMGTAVPAFASYRLNPEVKDATPALQRAAEIGVREYSNPKLQNLPNKDAIVVMSFGTTYKNTRAKTIEATVEAIKKDHPHTKVVLAFTSHIIIDRIKANEGKVFYTPEEVLQQLRKEGYTRVALTSLDIIPGMEYHYDTAVFDLYKHQFKKMTMGLPLMYWMGQENQRDDIMEVMRALKSQFPPLKKNEAILLMAHGTPSPANAYYAVMQDRLDVLNDHNVYIYSVEGWPHLQTVIPELQKKGIKKVILMPLMMVAGDHANNDMAGSEPDSHKSILEKEGFQVSTYLHGLGENPNIQKIFVERANEAWQVLESTK